MDPNTDPPIAATGTCFAVVESLYELGGAGVTELTASLDLPKSTVHDHLRSLHAIGYVVQREGEYRLGMRFLALGERERRNVPLYRIARPEIDQLAEQTGEHANLMIEEHGDGVYLYIREGEQAARLDTHAGFRTLLHTTALGKAILSELPRERVESIVETTGLAALTKNTITDEETLYEELDDVRERGYAVDREERALGVRCVAAPVVDGTTGTVGALSVSGLVSSVQGERLEQEVPALVTLAANKVEVSLNYS